MVFICSLIGPDPEVGGLYEPSLLADYDTTLFKFKSAKLAQQEVYTPDGDLVAPWDAPNSLRPGTLVAVEANLIVYTFCRPKDPSTVCIFLVLLEYHIDACLGISDPGP